MNNARYDHGFGSEWTDLYSEKREGYSTSVADFHAHPYYEINLILSGSVRILLKDRAVDGGGNYMVLTKPGTPHFISCSSEVLYSRLYLSFSEDFIQNSIAEWRQLLEVFGKGGAILALSPHQTQFCQKAIEEIRAEKNSLRRRLAVLTLLSHLSEMEKKQAPAHTATPAYIIEALSYLNLHYNEKIVAEELAHRLFICRTTLMTAFKKYTGSTFHEYLTRLRLQHATALLQDGKSLQETAEQCGFCDSSGLIRSFRQYYHTTPRRYLLQKKDGLSAIL